MEMQSFEGKMGEKKKGREDESDRSRGGREGLNFNLRVTEFTDICTVDPPSCSSQLFRNNTFSPFNPWDLFFLLHSPQNETIHSLEGRERRKKKHREKQTELNVLNSSDACVTICNPECPQDSSRIIVCILMGELTRGGREKNDMWQAIHLSCQHVIFATFKPHVSRSFSLSGEGDLGRNQLTHPDTAGECMEIPQWERRTRARTEGKFEQKDKRGKWKKMWHLLKKRRQMSRLWNGNKK